MMGQLSSVNKAQYLIRLPRRKPKPKLNAAKTINRVEQVVHWTWEGLVHKEVVLYPLNSEWRNGG